MASTARRAHTKSRNGCTGCKSRRVKCDEKVPCGSCAKRGMLCSLETESESSRASQLAAVEVQNDDLQERHSHEAFKESDFALFHHFITSTAALMTSTPYDRSPFTKLIPELAPQYPYLLHEVLAVAALHLAHLHPAQSNEYIALGIKHQSKALSLYRPAMEKESPETAIPIFACSAMFVTFYFALPSDPASLLFNQETSGPPDWMFPVRGVKLLFAKNANYLDTGGMQGYATAYVKPWKESKNSRDFPAKPIIQGTFGKLSIPVGDEELYAATIEDLLSSFWMSYVGALETRKSAALTFVANVKSEFLDRLGHRHQPALVIMAFWCVVMHRIEFFGWYKNAKAKEMLGVIKGLLTPENLQLISWAIQEIDGNEAG